ncbi:DNA repair protein RadA [Candidatus Shapirobacteria bacterium CG03_land_8_20_14_0_80_39_12]|uniref:DNA repair protein RadA n=1 Tax=Candidatus Shapirobacteria bacterium CG03_land_8_20_14_0_80_39_12 TaxID=1974879 RepID=A0A2M7BC58_9BACT|nr:MAG: DNA repair protein RadA [Candidatus Shapirobacteria bacterium CG03_land_8_20_14_0_80_39_12]
MKKKISNFVCSECGYESVEWYGKCPNCGQWNTMKEFKEQRLKFKDGGRQDRNEENKPLKLSEIKTSLKQRFSSGIEEFDRVLGNGFVKASVILLAGEPGVGKSTLLLQLVKKMSGLSILYVSGEESPEQVKGRAERLGVEGTNLLLLSETNADRIIEEFEKIDGETLVIIDSIQTLWSEDFESYPGSVSQVRGCAQKLLEIGKKKGITLILVGHVTKEGEIAGPMILSHMVDVVLFLEGERFTELRLLRGFKNRFGPTDEVGVFKMSEKGMEEVKNPSEIFLGDRGNEARLAKDGESRRGSVTVCAMEGTRPMLLEIQALVAQSALAIPRRVVSGVDYNRVLLLSAVLQKALNIPLYNQDIFVKVAGGFKISEPAADLGICLAIISSFKNQSLSGKICAFGEVGLLGEIRRVSGEEKRAKEAKKLGFSQVLSSVNAKSLHEVVRIINNK